MNKRSAIENTIWTVKNMTVPDDFTIRDWMIN